MIKAVLYLLPVLFALLLYIIPDPQNVKVVQVSEIPEDPQYDYYLILFPNETFSGSLTIGPSTPDVNYIQIRSLIYDHYSPRLLSKSALLSKICTFDHLVNCPNPSYDYNLIKIDRPEGSEPVGKDVLSQARFHEKDDKDKSIKMYEQISEESGFIRQKIFYAMYRLAVLHMRKDMFLSAYHYYPHRKEPLYYLTRMERTVGNFSGCLLYGRSAMMVGSPSIDELFVENAIYNYAVEMEVAHCLHHSGRIEEAKKQNKHLSERTHL